MLTTQLTKLAIMAAKATSHAAERKATIAAKVSIAARASIVVKASTAVKVKNPAALTSKTLSKIQSI